MGLSQQTYLYPEAPVTLIPDSDIGVDLLTHPSDAGFSYTVHTNQCWIVYQEVTPTFVKECPIVSCAIVTDDWPQSNACCQ